MNYKKLKIDYNPSIFKKPFVDNKEFNNREYFQELTIDLISYELPMFNLFSPNPSKNELTIFKLLKNVPLHKNPNNAGLVLIPISGRHEYNFPDSNEKIIIEQPTIINGQALHEYKKLDDDVIVYAVKIPMLYTWDHALDMVSDYIVG